MGADRLGLNVYWNKVWNYVDGELVNAQKLYTDGINRVHDNTTWLLGRIGQIYSDLANTDAGTPAKITGTVRITDINFDSGAFLNGKTIILDEETTTPQTCTFGVVTTPSELLLALATQIPTNITFSISDGGYLVAETNTSGAVASLALVLGSSAGTDLFGFTSASTTGLDNFPDGTTKIGFSGYSGLTSGTLRQKLIDLYERMLPVTGGVMTGAIEFNDTNTASSIRYRKFKNVAAANGVFIDQSADVHRLPTVLGANRVYTMRETSGTIPSDGDRTVVVLKNPSHQVTLVREGGANVFVVAGGTSGYLTVELQFDAFTDIDGAWNVVGAFSDMPLGPTALEWAEFYPMP